MNKIRNSKTKKALAAISSPVTGVTSKLMPHVDAKTGTLFEPVTVKAGTRMKRSELLSLLLSPAGDGVDANAASTSP